MKVNKKKERELAEAEARMAENQLERFIGSIAPNLMRYMAARGIKPVLSWQRGCVSFAKASYVFKNEELEELEEERRRAK